MRLISLSGSIDPFTVLILRYLDEATKKERKRIMPVKDDLSCLKMTGDTIKGKLFLFLPTLLISSPLLKFWFQLNFFIYTVFDDVTGYTLIDH